MLVLITAFLFFTFRELLPKGEKKDADIQGTISEERKSASTNQQEGELEEESEVDQHERESEDTRQQEETQREETDLSVVINGVDDAYVHTAGTVIQKDGKILLQMWDEGSVCAYNEENEIIKKDNVKYLILEGEDAEEYVGTEVEIKGSLTAASSGEFCLRLVKVDIKKEAYQEETVQGEENAFENHQYYLIVDDVTWQEAFDDCISRGGYLAQINSEEEFQLVIRMIEDENKQNIHFYLGGRREESGREYRWVNAENQFVGDMLNPEGTVWTSSYWMENEPSFISEEENEMFMNLIYYKERWVLNDVPMDITRYYPGKTGYICEIER